MIREKGRGGRYYVTERSLSIPIYFSLPLNLEIKNIKPICLITPVSSINIFISAFYMMPVF